MDPKSKYDNVIRYILSEKWLTITVIGSVFTFQFISAFKTFILDPLLDITLPYEKFKFMDVKLKDGEEIPTRQMAVKISFGSYFIEFVKWGVLMVILYLLAKYTTFPETEKGNVLGAAIM